MIDRLGIGVIGPVHDLVWRALDEFRKIENAAVTCAADLAKPLLGKVKVASC